MFRRHGRTAIRCPMLLKHQTLGDLDVVTNNISASGVFVAPPSRDQQQSLPPLQIGDTVETEVESEGADEPDLVLLKVVRQTSDGFGLAFVYS